MGFKSWGEADMRCSIDGTDRSDENSEDWEDDAEWGVVHMHAKRWHTVTGTPLRRLKDGNGFVPRSTSGPVSPALPAAPGPRPGHPGLPSRAISPADLADDE